MRGKIFIFLIIVLSCLASDRELSDSLDLAIRWDNDKTSSDPANVGMTSFFYIEIDYRENLENTKAPLIYLVIQANNDHLHLSPIGDETAWQLFHKDRNQKTTPPSATFVENELVTEIIEFEPELGNKDQAKKIVRYYRLGVDREIIPQEYEITVSLFACAENFPCFSSRAVDEFESVFTETLPVEVQRPLYIDFDGNRLELGKLDSVATLTITNEASDLEPLKYLIVGMEIVSDQCKDQILFCPKLDTTCSEADWSAIPEELEHQEQVTQEHTFTYKIRVSDTFYCDSKKDENCNQCHIKFKIDYDTFFSDVLISEDYFSGSTDSPINPLEIYAREKTKMSLILVNEKIDPDRKINGPFYDGYVEESVTVPLKLKNIGNTIAHNCRADVRIKRYENTNAYNLFDIKSPIPGKKDANDLITSVSFDKKILPGKESNLEFTFLIKKEAKEVAYPIEIDAICENALAEEEKADKDQWEKLFINATLPKPPELHLSSKVDLETVDDGDQVTITANFDAKGKYPAKNCVLTISGLKGSDASLKGSDTEFKIDDLRDGLPQTKNFYFTAELDASAKSEWKNGWKENKNLLSMQSGSIDTSLSLECEDKFGNPGLTADSSSPGTITINEKQSDVDFRVKANEEAIKTKNMLIAAVVLILFAIGGFMYMQKQKTARLKNAGRRKAAAQSQQQGYQNQYYGQQGQAGYYQGNYNYQQQYGR